MRIVQHKTPNTERPAKSEQEDATGLTVRYIQIIITWQKNLLSKCGLVFFSIELYNLFL